MVAGCSVMVAAAQSMADSAYGWPAQKAPAAIITCRIQKANDLKEMNSGAICCTVSRHRRSMKEKTKEGKFGSRCPIPTMPFIIVPW